MQLDRLACALASYEAGAATEGETRLEILVAAGEGDAQAVFRRLPHELRESLIRELRGLNADDAKLIESNCGITPSAQFEAGVRRRAEAMRRGIWALQKILAGHA